MSNRSWIVIGGCALLLGLGLASTAVGHTKTATAGSKLLLPYYEVDTTNVQGVTTLFAVRNQLAQSVDVTISYYEANGPQSPFATENLTLSPRQVRTFNVRTVGSLDPDADGIARGFVIIESSTEGALLIGDTFRITPNQDFAGGKRLLDITPNGAHNDLCSLFSVRFLNGGGFDSGTIFNVWVDLPEAPDPEDGTNIFFVNAWTEGGTLLVSRGYQSTRVSFQVTAEELLNPVSNADFGAMDFEFPNGSTGHISVLLNASGRYSVELEAICGDP